MEKLPKEAFGDMLPISQRRNTLLRAQLLQLAIGEVLFLPKQEWKTKNSPYYIVAYIKKHNARQFEYGKKIDGTGWLFRRLA